MTPLRTVAIALSLVSIAYTQQAESGRIPSDRPWMNSNLSPDVRAEMVLKEMTLDEKVGLLHGNGMAHVPNWQMPLTHLSNGGAGMVVGVPRLGIPALYLSDAAYGVRSSGENGRYSTALPSGIALAATWDIDAAHEYGALIGRELRAQGYNMSLGGGVNLMREPRNGRSFEYQGEDPILAGTMVGHLAKGTQEQHVVGDIKHYVLNDQETGRNFVNVKISKRAMQETDLFAFQIGLRISDAGAVMCSYNRIEGDYACENAYTLNQVLKKEWGFKGFVISDWGATHSTEKASAAGLDQEQPMADFFGPKLKEAVEAGRVPMSEIDDHARRVLRAEFASGIIDDPVKKSVVDAERGFEIAQNLEERAIVLLKNENGVLPLSAGTLRSIAVIGPHADVGMISGGGSAQVDPPAGNAIEPPGKGETKWGVPIWFPTSPLKAIRAKARNAQVAFNSGADPAAAAALAKNSDVAIVFVYQWQIEGQDLPSLSLPDNQDTLIAQVAAANPRTVVVLETGGPVTMPWIDKVPGIVEAWYAGSRGHIAVANVLFGDVNPSAKLPVTFPKSMNDLPHPVIAPLSPEDQNRRGPQAAESKYSVEYDEGLKVGYKWYDAEKKSVLFPFGHGLSYTTFSYSGLKINPGPKVTVTFTVTNSGKRAGVETPQVYVSLPDAAQEPPKRLVSWSKVTLPPGQSRRVTVEIDPQYLQIFDEPTNAWKSVPGQYTFAIGGSSQELPLKEKVTLQ